MKKYKIIFFIFTFLLTIILLTPAIDTTLPHFPITTHLTNSASPFSFYSIHAYENTNSNYEYKENTIYYQIQETAHEPFDDLSISIEDTVVDDTVFQEYNAIVFLEKINYTYELYDITMDDADTLTIVLSYYANTESTEYLHGGMILIPKWYQFKNINFMIHTNDAPSKQAITKSHSTSYIPNSSRHYTPIKISSNLIKTYSIKKYQAVYYVKITDMKTLKKLIEDFELEVTSSDLEKYESILSYRNLVITINDDFYFSCHAKTEFDEHYNELWDTEKLELEVTVSPKDTDTKFTYLIFNFIPKSVHCDTIEFNYTEKVLENYENNEIKVSKSEALEIAKNYFDPNSEIESFIGPYNENYMEFLYSYHFFDFTYRNMWCLSGRKNSYYRTIYVDATTGEIKIEM